MLATLLMVARKNKLTVLDFGGSLGTTYNHKKNYLKEVTRPDKNECVKYLYIDYISFNDKDRDRIAIQHVTLSFKVFQHLILVGFTANPSSINT